MSDGQDLLRPEGITEIRIQGFKSLVDSGPVRIAPLTLLAGANSSGKSSLMQPLLLLKQTLESPFDPGGLLLDGPHVSFTNAAQYIPQRIPAVDLCVEVKLNDFLGLVHSVSISFGAYRLLSSSPLRQRAASDHGNSSELRMNMSRKEALSSLSGDDWLQKLASTPSSGVTVQLERGFLRVIVTDDDGRIYSSYGHSAIQRLRQDLQEILHLGAYRGNPARYFPVTTSSGPFPGPFSPYYPSVLMAWRHSRQWNDVSNDLKKLGLGTGVDPIKIDDTRVEVHILENRSDGSKARTNLPEVGFGASQALPLIVALRAGAPGQVVYIEQPELHLHPRAQLAMATILVQAANRGVRVVAETHSELLLLGVQTAIAKGEIASDKVAMHWFERDDEGVTTIQTADIDDSGRFGEWPVDFVGVEMDAQDAYLSAVHARRKKGAPSA